MTLKVYNFQPSLWAAVPRLIIEEKSIPAEYIQVDLSKAENFSPEFLKINPQATIPVLVDEEKDKKITDSITISHYLDEITGNTLTPFQEKEKIQKIVDYIHQHDVGNPLFALFGSIGERDIKKGMVIPFLEGRIQGWEHYKTLNQGQATLYEQKIKETQPLLQLYHATSTDESIYQPIYQQYHQLSAVAIQVLNYLEQQLNEQSGNGNDKQYLVGNTYTLADVHATPVLFRLILVKGKEAVFDQRPSLKAYYDIISSRPNFKTLL
ncbi:thioredoxin-like protein [Cunninghamella echinulata]|nr:thioredoxin-like protein [Cunninghamella echinulata]